MRPWPKARAAAVSEGVIPAVLTTGRYEGRMYAAPLNTGSQVLFYRKDRVETPPKTWDEMLRMAADLPEGQRRIQVQGARYEGYTVWFNSLLASAGGEILNRRGEVSLRDAPTRDALRVMRERRDRRHRRPVALEQQGGREPDRVPAGQLVVHGQLHQPAVVDRGRGARASRSRPRSRCSRA